jgi:hypothetical protein
VGGWLCRVPFGAQPPGREPAVGAEDVSVVRRIRRDADGGRSPAGRSSSTQMVTSGWWPGRDRYSRETARSRSPIHRQEERQQVVQRDQRTIFNLDPSSLGGRQRESHCALVVTPARSRVAPGGTVRPGRSTRPTRDALFRGATNPDSKARRRADRPVLRGQAPDAVPEGDPQERKKVAPSASPSTQRRPAVPPAAPL